MNAYGIRTDFLKQARCTQTFKYYFQKFHQQISKKKKIMDVSKNLTHFCYPTRLVLHQHLNSLVAVSEFTHRPRVNSDADEALD